MDNLQNHFRMTRSRRVCPEPCRRVITIGSFDGVHRGHAAVLRETVRHARRMGGQSLAISFNVPPRMILHETIEVELLTTPEERRLLIQNLGVDEVCFLKFSKIFSRKTPRSFFDNVLIKEFSAAGLVVGPDFRFGHNRTGDPRDLARWGEGKIPLWPVPFAKSHDHKISSGHIRHLLKEGDLDTAETELGHRYFAVGTVIHGQGLGRRIGFPTLNLAVEKGKVLPPGVYAVRVFKGSYSPAWSPKIFKFSKTAKEKKPHWPGVCNIGVRPTVTSGKGPLSFEIHLLDVPPPAFESHPLWVEFVTKLREEKRFSSLNDLKSQIKHDIAQTHALLYKPEKTS